MFTSQKLVNGIVYSLVRIVVEESVYEPSAFWTIASEMKLRESEKFYKITKFVNNLSTRSSETKICKGHFSLWKRQQRLLKR